MYRACGPFAPATDGGVFRRRWIGEAPEQPGRHQRENRKSEEDVDELPGLALRTARQHVAKLAGQPGAEHQYDDGPVKGHRDGAIAVGRVANVHETPRSRPV
jgi:hypothetical protein